MSLLRRYEGPKVNVRDGEGEVGSQEAWTTRAPTLVNVTTVTYKSFILAMPLVYFWRANLDRTAFEVKFPDMLV